jgi:hypothetical protein
MMTMMVPAESQRMQALGRANEVRIARSKLKQQIKTFEVDICDVIMDPPEIAEGMGIGDLLKSLHRFGDHRVALVVNGVCRSNLTLGRMGSYTRGRLCDRIDDALGRPARIR